jgi:hypothetical protein
MTSDRQIEANRRNAKLTTGPRTKRGKAASSPMHCVTAYRGAKEAKRLRLR